MKKQFYILTIIFFALAMFSAPTAKADGIFDWGWGWGSGDNGHNDNDHNNNDHNNNNCNDNDNTKLPINNGVLFLTIAGMGIGVILIGKSKAVKTAVNKG